MLFKIATIAAVIGVASAACPNQCSGHGACGNQDVCECYDNWGMGGAVGGDCSDRLCPFELAWVDTPNSKGTVHNYAECAGKGVCDRSSAECECLDGYEGKACARQTCKDNCNGHGTCAYMSQIPFGTVSGDFNFNAATNAAVRVEFGKVGALGFVDTLDAWDAERSRACICDSEWSGLSCDKKMCPHGNDAMFVSEYQDETNYLNQKQEIVLKGKSTWGSTPGTVAASPVDAPAGFALTFTSRTNQTFTTVPITLPTFSAECQSNCEGLTSASTPLSLSDCTALQVAPCTPTGWLTDIKEALEGLPNHVVDSVTVNVAYSATTPDKTITITVEFDGDNVQGRQNLLEIDIDPCKDGCTPYVKGLVHNLVQSASSIREATDAAFNSYECGRRGKCDFDTGTCSCFEGFTGPACSSITALI